MSIFRILPVLAVCVSAWPALAQENPFGSGWQLEPAASSLQFSSIKNQSVIETSTFATFSGGIAPDGTAKLSILLDSVDTKADLRNVRMRFLFFETFLHPEATITARIAPELVADLAQVRRKTVTLPFVLDLHGIRREETAQMSLTLIQDDLIAVSSAEPITLRVADYNLANGLEKLEEAADVTIVPSTTVNFDLIFRATAGDRSETQLAAAATPAAPASSALETEGDFSIEACTGRFEILSRTGNIYFKPGSARLNDDSTPLLNQVYDIVSRCPDLRVVVAGHTDSVGSRGANQRLSERRAASVLQFLAARGIAPARLRSVGYGEDRPVADNTSDRGRSKNRRIEFSAESG